MRKSLIRPHRFLWTILGGATLAFGAALGVMVVPSYAALDTGPLSGSQWLNVRSGGSNPAKASYVVSRDGLTDITRTSIKIYVPANSRTAQIKINNYDMCTTAARQLGTTNSFDQSITNTSGLSGSGRLVSSYNFSAIGGGSVNTNGWNGRGAWNDNCMNSSRTIDLSNAPIDSATGMRVYRLDATASSITTAGERFVNLFWLQSQTDGVIFSQIGSANGGADAKAFGYQLSSPIPSAGNRGTSPPESGTFYNMVLPFGSDCSVSGNTNATISFYDLDYPDDNAVQPQSRPIYLRLVDQSNGRGLPLAYGAGNQGQVTNSTDGSNTYTIRRAGNQEYLNLRFTARPNGKYKLYVSQVYYNNTLQFVLPYESVFYYTSCKGELTGSTTLNKTFMLPGDTATWRHQVRNISTSGIATDVDAKIHRQITKNGRAGAVQTRDLLNDATIPSNSGRPNPPRSSTFTAEASDVGATICEWISWTSDSGNGNNRSGNYCVTVGKQPKLQIWGGDLRAGDDVDTSISTIRSKSYGSWDEYAAFINGYNQNNNFASAAATEGGLARGGQVKRLTFANTNDNGAPTTGWGGGYSNTPPGGQAALTSFADGLGLPNRTGFNSTITNMGQSGVYTTPANTTRNFGGNVGPGKTIVVKAGGGGVIRINQNITYQGSNLQLSRLPQVIIIADTIRIDSDVTRVDAWLVANRVITCSGESPSLSRCEKKLQVNGPTAAQNADFKRTAGSDDTARAGDPAEVLNLRADAYLWAYGQASKDAIPTTIKVTNLPPRY